MSIEIGHYALVLALCIAIALATLLPLGLLGKNAFCRHLTATSSLARPLASAMFILCLFASAMLIRAFLLSDFSALLVWQNSHSSKPMLYKFAAMWGNHEGSMLLWVLVLSLFAMLIAFFTKSQHAKQSPLTTLTLSIQSAICALFLAFTLFFSNPFARAYPVAADGMGLNPILQHPALAIHPPLLYLGYVGLSAAFSTTIAALILNNISNEWARATRFWTLLAWVFLAAGITLGAWWAYEELGWGGFWFWDPVENASLMPWLLATAALHALMSFIKTARIRAWAILLVLLAFSASMLGTFLVRSGILVSVHSFASDPLRGIVILLCVTIVTASALALFAWRKNTENSTNLKPFPLLSREGAQFINILLLSCCCALVMLATLYPLFFEFFTKRSIAIGPPYYTAVLTPFFLVIVTALGILPALGWRRSSRKQIIRHASIVAPIATGSGIAVFLVANYSASAAIAVAFGIWALIGAARTKGAPGVACAHAGIAILLIACASASLNDVEKFRTMRVGNTITLNKGTSSTKLELKNIFTKQGSNYNELGARFQLNSKNTLTPAIRTYIPSGIKTTEASINRTILRDIYVTIATLDERSSDSSTKNRDTISVRVRKKPLMFWVWAGAAITIFGGILSLIPRNLLKRRLQQ